jgi:hypothetical protein
LNQAQKYVQTNSHLVNRNYEVFFTTSQTAVNFLLNRSNLFFNSTYKNMKTAMQELFSQLEIEHPNLFNTNTLEGRKFINDYYKFFEMEKQQIEIAFNEGQQEESKMEFWTKGEYYYNKTFKIK